jgi:hypothetical protein
MSENPTLHTRWVLLLNIDQTEVTTISYNTPMGSYSALNQRLSRDCMLSFIYLKIE